MKLLSIILEDMVRRSDEPFNLDIWQVKTADGKPLAHLAARMGCLPEDFDRWDLASIGGWTVAHEAAMNGMLPKNFNGWDMKDDDNISVAQVAAMRLKVCDLMSGEEE